MCVVKFQNTMQQTGSSCIIILAMKKGSTQYSLPVYEGTDQMLNLSQQTIVFNKFGEVEPSVYFID